MDEPQKAAARGLLQRLAEVSVSNVARIADLRGRYLGLTYLGHRV